MNWSPSANNTTLHKRAQILRETRAFFQAQNVLEVDVPILSSHAVTDVNLHSIAACVGASQDTAHYLTTSPEFFMKRLLSANVGSIYYLGKAFRNDELSKHHNPEFTMLEWYRIGWDYHELIREVIDLIQTWITLPVQRISYAELFLQHFDIDPHRATMDQLITIATQKFEPCFSSDQRDTWLDFLFSHGIQTTLSGISVIYDYPVEQAALAETYTTSDITIGKRFEVFINDVELANGYQELTDAEEQLRRFNQDNINRRSQGLTEIAHDVNLIAALENGLPKCAGVALGFDRLCMAILNKRQIKEVMSFDNTRI